MNTLFRRFFLVALVAVGLQVATVHRAEAIERQLALNWCWAASIQDVLYGQRGVYQTQQQISAALTGWPQDRPATIGEVVYLAQRFGLQAWQAGRPGTPQELYGALANGAKLIAFVRPSAGPVGHYIVVEGFDPTTGVLFVSDPAIGMTFQETPAGLYARWRWVDSVVTR
jgi:hypothetical protein